MSGYMTDPWDPGMPGWAGRDLTVCCGLVVRERASTNLWMPSARSSEDDYPANPSPLEPQPR